MGDEFNICVVNDDVDNDGGVNVVAASSILPRCARAVRLSDAFCFLITSWLPFDTLRGIYFDEVLYVGLALFICDP